MGNGRAISVLAAREGAAVACADKDRAAALPVLAPRSSIVYISSAASLRAATGAPL
jgi:hypothetical protein